MTSTKKLLFLSGTRADFGKLKSLMQICEDSPEFETHIFVTGMHMHHQYGYTVKEIEKSGFKKKIFSLTIISQVVISAIQLMRIILN